MTKGGEAMADTEKNKTEGSTLYLVATPIGNLADITERAKKVLSEVDFVAAEDTRNTAKLLSCYGIHAELVQSQQQVLVFHQYGCHQREG